MSTTDNQADVQSTGERTPRRRSLYRQGSLTSQIDSDGIILQPFKDGDSHSVRTGRSDSVGSRHSSIGMRCRTPSGKSIRSRTASRAEYHHDLQLEMQQGMTRNLLWGCFLIMFGSSFLFGWNIGVLNQPVTLIKNFYNATYSNRSGEINPSSLTVMWSLTTTILFPGGMIGAYSAGFLADKFGRKGATLLSHIPAFIGAILSAVCVAARSPELLMVGRFITGINCGFATQLAPMYLTEIAPFNLRGAIGTGHQLFITIGIFMGSVFGLKSILGTEDSWPYLLLLNALPALVSLLFMPFISESPRYLHLIKKDRIGAERALRFFLQKPDVSAEVEEMETESNESEESKETEVYTMKKLFTTKDLHMPLFVAVMLQVVQQLSGINAVFFYSSGIFRTSGVPASQIQYAVIGTNAVNVIMTIVAVPLIERLGRRPLMIYPMLVMNVILIILTISLNLQVPFRR